MNRVEISGGLTRDPDTERTGTGVDKVTLTVAVNGTRWDRQAGTQVVKTTYVVVEAWDFVAVSSMGFKKGDDVYVVGEINQVRKDGSDKPSTRVTAFRVDLIRESPRHQGAPAPTSGQPAGDQRQDDPWA